MKDFGNNAELHKFILINTTLKSCYAKIKTSFLTKEEASVMNKGFSFNKVNKKYILESDWK